MFNHHFHILRFGQSPFGSFDWLFGPWLSQFDFLRVSAHFVWWLLFLQWGQKRSQFVSSLLVITVRTAVPPVVGDQLNHTEPLRRTPIPLPTSKKRTKYLPGCERQRSSRCKSNWGCETICQPRRPQDCGHYGSTSATTLTFINMLFIVMLDKIRV